MNGNDQFFLQQNMNLLCRDESCSVYQMKNGTNGDTELFKKSRNINGFRACRIANNLY